MRRCLAIRERWKIADEASEGIEYSREDDTFLNVRRKALADAKAFVQDGSQYCAELVTGPDFGCVLHEPAPT
jgi:hypothetical protein